MNYRAWLTSSPNRYHGYVDITADTESQARQVAHQKIAINKQFNQPQQRWQIQQLELKG